MHPQKHTIIHGGIYGRSCRKSPRPKNTQHFLRQNLKDIPSLNYSRKGDTRTDGEKIKEEFGNRPTDGFIIFKYRTETTQEQTETDRWINTLVLLDFCRSRSKTIGQMRTSYEEKKYTYSDLQEDLACHNKDIRMEVGIFQGNYAAAVYVKQ